MINLVPAIVRKAIVKEYLVRMATVFLFMLSTVTMLLVVIAMPVYVFVSSQVETYVTSANEAAARVAEYDVSNASLAKATAMAQKLFEQENTVNFSELISKLEAARGSGVEVTDYGISRNGKEINPIIINGKADTRQSLIDFKNEIMKLPEVETVDLPLTNLAKDRDINFAMSIIFKKTI